MCSVPRIKTYKTKTQCRRTYIVGYNYFQQDRKMFFRRTEDSIIQ